MEKLNLRDDKESFQHFLDEYCKYLKQDSEENEYVPLRISNPRLTVEEIEGECLEWCLHFLSTRKCPGQLAALLAREVYVRVSNLDLQNYVYLRDDGRTCMDDSNSGDEEEGKAKVEETVIEYNAEKLQDAVLDTLESVCTSWQAELPDIEMAGDVRQHAYYAIKNTRRKMEDSHVIVPDLNSLFSLKDCPRQSFYGVFDGHAGVDAANFAARHIHCNMVHRCPLDTDPGAAIQEAFRVTDQLFIPKAKRERWRSGSTGVTALVRGDKLYMSWLGDSQAVLVRDGCSVTHMEPHKPDRQDERERIEGQGGFVMLMGDLWRVGGNLAVSRAIGDCAYKPFISSEAEVLVEDLDGSEDYMVLACDGLWDVIEEAELPRIVHAYLSEGGEKNGAAKHLVQLAKSRDSTDNISVIIVFFRENIAEPKFDLFNFGTVKSQGGEETQENQSDKGDKSDRQENKVDDSKEDGLKDNVKDSGGVKEDSDKDDVKDDGKTGMKDEENINVRDEEAENSLAPSREHSNRPIPAETDTVYRNGRTPSVHRSGMTPSDTLNSVEYTHKYSKGSISGLSPSNLQEIDLDYYSVFDGQKDLPHSEHNSSNLLRDIAEAVYLRKYSSMAANEYDTAKENFDTHVTKGRFTNRGSMKKKPKKPKYDLPKVKKEYNKKGLATTPVCWAFTGRNKANVQNHKLNMGAKSTIKGTNPTPGELTLASKAPPNLAEKSPRFTMHGGVTNNIYAVGINSVPLSHLKLEALNLPKQKLTSPGRNTVFGSKNCFQTESDKFHTSWRPRKPLKPIAPTLMESPPTPFTNSRLDASREQ